MEGREELEEGMEVNKIGKMFTGIAGGGGGEEEGNKMLRL